MARVLVPLLTQSFVSCPQLPLRFYSSLHFWHTGISLRVYYSLPRICVCLQQESLQVILISYLDRFQSPPLFLETISLSASQGFPPISWDVIRIKRHDA